MSHAKFSPSAASRWTKCPGSISFDSIEDAGSDAARRGTQLHEWAAKILLSDEPFDHDMTDEELEWVLFYRHVVFKIGGELRVEQKVRYNDDLWGTADALIMSEGVLHVVDFKTGMLKVEAQQNLQMITYALCALREFDRVFPGFDVPQKVMMHIVQPSIKYFEGSLVDVAEIFLYEKPLLEAMENAISGDPDFLPGENQCRWCRGQAVCKPRADYNLKLALEDFNLENRLNLAEIANVLDEAAQIRSWLDSVEDHAIDLVLKGEKIPGYKMIEGRTSRKWTDNQEVIEALKAAGLENPVVVNPITITAAEKMLGKTHAVFSLTYKPEGKPALAKETDKRPEFRPTEL